MDKKKEFNSIEDIKQENEVLNFLKEKIPHVFQEGDLDVDVLKSELGLLNEDYEAKEKYGLYWKGKFNAWKRANTSSIKTLVPQRDKSLNFDQSDNIIIEGDNLEVLKLLEKSYSNKVDVIYIDPPYNTGNDFIYNDDFKEDSLEYKIQNGLIDDEGYKTTTNQKTDGRFHTNWLNMMYPRLMLARKLLKDDGVIFISIDDNEQARLKLMCDEIFGEQNFICNFSVENNPKGRKNNNFISQTHEYCLAYSTNKNNLIFKKIVPKHANDMEKDENGIYIRKSGKRILVGKNELNNFVKDFNSDKHYSIYLKDKEIKIKKEKTIEDKDTNLLNAGFKRYITYLNNQFVENTYTFSKLVNLFHEGALDIREDKIYEKHFSDMMQLKSCLKNQEYEAIVNNKKVKYLLDLKTTSAKEHLNLILNKSDFDGREIYPKNISFIKTLLSLIDKNKGIFLDFFAGSGTTGQAIMELNKEDGGNRKYILVQLPEKLENNDEFETICDITRERIKRSIEMYDYKEKGFKTFKLVDSNLKTNQMTNQNSVKEIQTKLINLTDKTKNDKNIEDLVYEKIIQLGLDLNTKIENKIINQNEVYFNQDKTHIFILKPTINQNYYVNIIDSIKSICDDQSEFNIFLNDNYFKNDEDKINFNEQIKMFNKNIKVRPI